MRKEITLEEMRAIQLDMLDKVHEFCVKYGIRYSLGGGSLLGAVRHGGYIPWDDDIDIMMPRPDYDCFLKTFEGVYSHYTVQHCKNNKNYPWAFAKIYDDRTELIDHFLMTGVFIDVFPIDGLPDESGMKIYLERMDKLIVDVFRNTKSVTMYHTSFLYRWIKYLLFHSHSKSVEKLDAYLHSFDFETSSYAGAIVGSYREKEYMKSEVFKKYIDMSFEDRMYKVIADYDLYLRKHYGDYMELPPKEKQVSHHDFEVGWR